MRKHLPLLPPQFRDGEMRTMSQLPVEKQSQLTILELARRKTAEASTKAGYNSPVVNRRDSSVGDTCSLDSSPISSLFSDDVIAKNRAASTQSSRRSPPPHKIHIKDGETTERNNGCVICSDNNIREILGLHPVIQLVASTEDDGENEGKKGSSFSGQRRQSSQLQDYDYDEKVYENMDAGCFFEDGRRKIDFVLVFETSDPQNSAENIDDRDPFPQKGEESAEKLQNGRSKFLASLQEEGVQLETAFYRNGESLLTFHKVHIPFDLLCEYAEEMSFRMPLSEHLLTHFDDVENQCPKEFTEQIFDRFKFIPNFFHQEVPNEPKRFLTAPFRKEYITNFRNHDKPEVLFKNRYRIRIAKEILANVSYGSAEKSETGIERMLAEGYFTAAYPLHDSLKSIAKTENDPDGHIQDVSKLSLRQILWEYWAHWHNWHKYQPVHHVRDYFGENVGIYFYYLGFYTSWLCPAAFVGFVVQICCIAYAANNSITEEICASNYTMCPSCDDCQVWFSESKCLFSSIGRAFDNPYTVFYACFISLWSVLFLEFWKRNIAQMGAHWEVYDFAPLEERPRPAYFSHCTDVRKNPVTGKQEPFFPAEAQRRRKALTGTLLLFVVVCIFGVLFCVVLSRSFSVGKIYELDVQVINDYNLAQVLANLVGTVVQLIGMVIITTIWKIVAVYLTEWEGIRTESEFESSLASKLSIISLLELYLPILYIAFFKGKALGGPGFYTRVFGLRLENCPNSDCLWEMATQLIIFFACKQWIQNVTEIGVPLAKVYLTAYLNERQAKKTSKAQLKVESRGEDIRSQVNNNRGFENDPGIATESAITIDNNIGVDNDTTEDAITFDQIGQKLNDLERSRTRWENDYFLSPNPGLFEEYQEMMVQFGFITLFACSFPIGPLLALANNILEIRSDAWKMTSLVRRPVPERAKDIGLWFDILFVLSRLAVFTNAYLMCFTSNYLDAKAYEYMNPEDSGLKNFYNFTLAPAPQFYLDDDPDHIPCWYEGYYDSDGNRTSYFWKLLVAKLCFMLFFEHLIFLIGIVLEAVIPDIPEDVELKMKREDYLAREIFSSYAEKTDVQLTAQKTPAEYSEDPLHLD